MVWAACIFGMPLPLFMEAIGASGLIIGLVSSFNQMAMIFQIVGALIVERMAWRKPFWASLTLLHRLLWFVPAMMPFLLPESREIYPWIMLGVILISASLANAGSAAWQSWMADLVPIRGGGQFWGLRQSWLTAASIVGVLGAGWLLDYASASSEPHSLHGFSLVFALAALFGLADVIIHLWVREPRAAPTHADEPLLQRVAAPLRKPAFRQFTISMGLWYFSVGILGAFQFVYLKRDLGFTYSMTAQLSLLAAIGGTVSGFFFGTLMDRIGSKTLCMLLVSAGPLTGISWFLLSDDIISLPLLGSLPQPMLLLGVAMVIGGAIYAGVVLCQLRLTALVSDAEGRTMAMAVHWTSVGLAGALGPIVGGAVMDWIDRNPLDVMLPLGEVPVAFFHVLVVSHMLSAWLLVMPVLRRMPASDRTLPISAALGRIFVLNPLQAVRNIYNISLLSAVSGSRERALTVRSLGRSKAMLAVTDLIEQLDDTSLDVQEEAIASLGEIGEQEAIDALARIMEDTDSLLRAQAARALRRHASRVPVKVWLAGLSSEERETQCECLRALGESDNPQVAIPHLLAALNSSDPKVRICSAIALGTLGDSAVAPALIEAWRHETNCWRVDALACAIGDSISERDAFYRLLERERKTPGEAFSALLERLSRAILSLPRDTEDSLSLLFAAIEESIRKEDYGKMWDTLVSLTPNICSPDSCSAALALSHLLAQSAPPRPADTTPPVAPLLLLFSLTLSGTHR